MLDTTLAARQKEFASYLVKGFPSLGLAGLPVRSASALGGNATRENECRAVTTGKLDHNSQGVMQWRLERLTDMQSWCVTHFKRWDTLEAQAAFCLYELKRDYPALDRQLHAGALPLETLTANFCDVFERPNKALDALGFVPGKGKGQVGRINYAYDIQAMMGAPIKPKAKAAGGAIVVVAAASAGGVHLLGGPWWVTALILVSGAIAAFALYRYFSAKTPK